MELSPHAIATLVLTGVALLLFSQERIRLEGSALLILILLVTGFTLFPYQTDAGSILTAQDFFSGFGHQALIAISALMILGRGIEKSGALKPLVRILTTQWTKHPTLVFTLMLLISGGLSGFLNNTPIVILLIPVLISVALNNKQAPSKILLPMGMATLIGGMGTTIGTSTNLLVVAISREMGGPDFQMFDFLLPAILVGCTGILFLALLGPRLLPERQIDLENTPERRFNAVIFLPKESSADGLELRKVHNLTHYETIIEKVMREQGQFMVPLPTLRLKSGDRLFINGTAAQIKELEQKLQGTLHNIDPKGQLIEGEYQNRPDEQQLAEILVTAGSLLHNRTLREARFARRFGVTVLALHRLNQPKERIRDEVKNIRLQPGDILLVQGMSENLRLLREEPRLLILESNLEYAATAKAPLAIAIMAGVIGLTALDLLPIAVSALLGAGLLILLRCLRWRDLTTALNIQVILIIVVSLGLGRALIETGGANYLAQTFVSLTQGMDIRLIIGLLIFLMSLLTNVVSNTAAAVVGTPIAITIAGQLHVPVEPFVLAVLFGANMSYATPIGYQTNLLIYSAGGYRFTDFLRTGIPLTLIIGVGFTLVLSLIYRL